MRQRTLQDYLLSTKIGVKLNNNSNVKYATIKNVLYVKDLHYNLLSVHSLEKAELQVLSEKGKVVILRNSEPLEIGKREKNL